MSILAAGTPVTERVRASVGVFITLAGLSAGITLLFLGMRAVMDIGGVCADGGPFVTRQSCPDGVPALMVGGIWGGIAFCALYVWQTIKHGVPSLLGLAWPALFLSLGWNFLEYGVSPPGDESGLVWGWLICGILFFIMGGVPLFATIKPIIQNFTDEDQQPPPFRSVIGEPVQTLRNLRNLQTQMRDVAAQATDPSAEPPSAPPEDSSDLVGELERLAALHRSGAIGDDEFTTAKRRLLEDGA